MELMKPYEGLDFYTDLPQKGMTSDQVMKTLEIYQGLSHVKWTEGRVSGGIYAKMSDQIFMKLIKDVHGETAYTNPLHPDVFPGIRKMEAEVVKMACTLFHGDIDSCGTMTSGGTESIVMACKAYRDYGKAVKGISSPEMLVPHSAHAAFDKASQLLKIRIVHIPCDPKTMKVDVKQMKKRITSRTILLVGSSPNFPNGIIDPIEEISKLGLKYNIPVHVDACLGGFLVPFMNAAGFPIPVVDFRLPGVTSISADTHKYGYAPKGSSVILYRNPSYRHHQFSVQTDWPGGVYASPTISGSRAGGTIATCWTSLMYHGREGYLNATKAIITTTRYLKQEIEKIPGIFIQGDPLMSVIAIGSDIFNVLEMSELLSKKGWNLNTLQFPPGFHICVTQMHTQDGVADLLLVDMKEIASKLVQYPKTKLTGQAAVYGMAAALPDRTLISDFAKEYLDGYYSTVQYSNNHSK